MKPTIQVLHGQVEITLSEDDLVSFGYLFAEGLENLAWKVEDSHDADETAALDFARRLGLALQDHVEWLDVVIEETAP